jgi:hypothetical protein
MANREVVTKVANAVLYSDGLIRIDGVRASYPHLGRPWSQDEDEKKAFSVTSLLSKTTHKAAKDLCIKRIDQLLKENKIEKIAADRKFIRDGDLSEKTENEGMFTVSARESRRPAIRDGDNNLIVDPDEIEELLYGGCFISVLIRPWFQNHKKFGKRVNAGLVAVRFMRDGKAFGEGRIQDEDIDDMMGDVADDDDDGGSSRGRSRRDSNDDDDL